ncbi:hypothetical protein KXQ82_15290 [Mucilaginibacter sp. HMF5004]|uniref:LptE family protein n=1 Tax=Mucilaginibacter rivuli TaxID=2857527 RepID=UPI001C5F194C|nr:LptE family protein [Mucilaginibacter rivuli]MBW4891089.1 hypothetical protein [Mucilaginibacter rivuli]
MNKRLLLLVFPLMFAMQACQIRLSGASIPPEMKTINVKFFENDAQLVVSTLSQSFTEALKDRIRTQTKLSIVRGEAHAIMEGTITGYTIAPVAIQASADGKAPVAGQTRLTITVSVTYTATYPNADKKNDFSNASFSRFKDFTGDISSQEQSLIQDINKQLTEDIFNKAFANW